MLKFSTLSSLVFTKNRNDILKLTGVSGFLLTSSLLFSHRFMALAALGY